MFGEEHAISLAKRLKSLLVSVFSLDLLTAPALTLNNIWLRDKNCLKSRCTTLCFHSPSYTLPERLLQTLVVSDFQERWAQRAASRPPRTHEQTQTAQAAGPTRRRSLGEDTSSLLTHFYHRLSTQLCLVRLIRGSHLVAGFHQAVWSGAECSCISFSPSAPLSPSWL